VLNWY